MRILHTGDWHLGDRLGRCDRTQDIRKNVERIAALCDEEQVEVLALAGDIFSDKNRHQDNLNETIDHLSRTFRRFLSAGGTILAVTGNHDNEIRCQTLRNALTLADPRDNPAGSLVAPGRLYLATGPTFYRVADHDGSEVQFVLMPYPTPPRYFDGPGQGAGTPAEINRRLQTAYQAALERIQASERFRQDIASVLIAHVQVRGVPTENGRELTEAQDVIFNDGSVPTAWAYVALGHVHRAQMLGGLEHVRYCGSIEHLNLDERDYPTSVVVFDIGPSHKARDIRVLQLPATPIYDVIIDHPEEEIPHLRSKYQDHEQALVQYRLAWKPGEHDRNALIQQIEAIFPRWYRSDPHEVGRAIEAARHASLPAEATGPERTVLHFLEKELELDSDRDDILTMAQELMNR